MITRNWFSHWSYRLFKVWDHCKNQFCTKRTTHLATLAFSNHRTSNACSEQQLVYARSVYGNVWMCLGWHSVVVDTRCSFELTVEFSWWLRQAWNSVVVNTRSRFWVDSIHCCLDGYVRRETVSWSYTEQFLGWHRYCSLGGYVKCETVSWSTHGVILGWHRDYCFDGVDTSVLLLVVLLSRSQ